MQTEQLENFFRVRDHLLQFIVAVLRFHDFDQLYLVELMHADHPARAESCRARLSAEARAVGDIANRQLLLRKNLLAMNVRDRSFGSGQQIQFAKRVVVVALAHRVGLVLELRELPHARHAIPADDVRRRDFGVAVLRRVQIEQHGDERSLQFCAPVRVEQECAAGKFRAARKVDELQLLAQFDVRLGFEGKLRLAAPLANLRVLLRRLANGHAGVRQIRQANQDGVARRLDLLLLRIKFADAVADRFRLGLLGFGLGELLLSHERANLFRDAIARGFELLDFPEQFSPLFIKREHFRNFRVIAGMAHRETFTNQISVFPDQPDIEHRGSRKQWRGKWKSQNQSLHL